MSAVIAGRARAVVQACRALGPWVCWVAWSAVLGGSVALLANTVLFGRVPLLQLLRGGSGGAILAFVFIAAAGWWLLFALFLRRERRALHPSGVLLPALPILLGATLPVVLIHVSDEANHSLHQSRPAAGALILVVLLATAFLQWFSILAARGVGTRRALVATAATLRGPFTVVLLGSLGALQAAAYQGVPGGDILRFWAVADGLLTGVGYPETYSDAVWVAGGMTSLVLDLPLHPALLAVSFTLFGHSAGATYAPSVVANILLPPLYYGLCREVIHGRVPALSMVALATLFPPFRFYTLNSNIPDPCFIAALVGASWLLLRIVRRDGRRAEWLLLGAMAAALVLLRPEGIAYALAYVALAVSVPASRARKVATLAVCGLPVAAFVVALLITQGTPWPRNWTGAFSMANVAANWAVMQETSLPLFATALRIEVPTLLAGLGLFLGLGLAGTLPWAWSPRRLSLLMVPVWLNLLAVLMLEPRVSYAWLAPEFFRHLSFSLPILLLAVGMAVQTLVGVLRHRGARSTAGVAANLALLVAVFWSVYFLSRPALNFGPGSGNLIEGRRVNLVEVLANPYPLPVLGFGRVAGHLVPTTPRDFLSDYPNQIYAFYDRLDPVRQKSGASYQSGSLLLYLAALLLALMPPWPRGPKHQVTDAPTGHHPV